MMRYYFSYYKTGDIYIAVYDDEDYYEDLTICLAEYGIYPKEGQIIIPVNMMRENDYKKYINDLIETTIRVIPYGPYDAVGVLAELKDNWRDICIPMDEL